jgi:hypothetical protein
VAVSLQSCWQPYWNCVPGDMRPAFSLLTCFWSGCQLSCASCLARTTTRTLGTLPRRRTLSGLYTRCTWRLERWWRSSSVDGPFSSPSAASTAASVVAVLSSRGMGRGGRGPGRGGRGGHGGRSSASARGGAQPLAGGQQAGGLAQAVPPLQPADLARIQHGLCFYHFNFGEQAHNCVAPCNWGN